MNQHSLDELIEVISADRFSTYELAAAGDRRHALALYAWNIACSAAFYGPLQVLEVALRNAIHRQLTLFYGSPTWWKCSELKLIHVHKTTLTTAEAKLQQTGKAFTSGKLIAELPLGFWVGLLGRGANYEMQLWRPAIRLAFPAYRGGRKQLHARFDHLRAFRNRIAHHEPIFTRHLPADFNTISELAKLICPATAQWMAQHSRVEAILSQRPRNGTTGRGLHSSF